MQLSRLNLLEGAPDTAVTFAEGALVNAPGNPEARVGLVRGLLGRRDFERAEQELAPLLKQYPEVGTVHALNGSLKLQKKDVAGARAEYERALSLAPNSIEALAGIIGVDLIQNRAPQARERIEARLAAEPNRVELLLMAGQVYGAQRDFAKAEATLRRAIQLDSTSSRAYSMLAGVLLASGKLDAARVEFDQMAQRDPRNVVGADHGGDDRPLAEEDRPTRRSATRPSSATTRRPRWRPTTWRGSTRKRTIGSTTRCGWLKAPPPACPIAARCKTRSA